MAELIKIKKMKKLLFIIPIILTSCVSYIGTYHFGITQVEKNGINAKGENALTYEDSIMSIKWTPDYTHFSFDLQNKSKKVFK